MYNPGLTMGSLISLRGRLALFGIPQIGVYSVFPTCLPTLAPNAHYRRYEYTSAVWAERRV